MFIKILGLFVAFNQTVGLSYGTNFTRSINYEEAWIDKKFSGTNLNTVFSLGPKSQPAQIELDDSKKNYLMDSLTLTNLKVLSLENQNVTDNEIEQLCNNPTFSRLFRINLSRNINLTDKSIKFISESPYIGSIRDLPQISAKYNVNSSEVYIDLTGTSINQQTIIKYNTAPQNTNFFIEYLHPKYNTQTAKTANKAIKWLQITSTNSQNSIQSEEFSDLIPDSMVRTLDFKERRLGNKIIQALEKSLLPNLEELDLEYNCIDNTQLANLSNINKFPNLKVLKLTANYNITDDGLNELRSDSNFSKLTALIINFNIHIGAKGVLALTRFSNFKILDLYADNIQDEGANILAEAHFPNLEELILGRNKISDKGSIALAKNKFTNLNKLDLRENPSISKKGQENLKKKDITNLWF